MTSDKLQEELGTLLGRCINVIRELETENAELKVRREWQGLTQEELEAALGLTECTDLESATNLIVAARAIEAALKEKNHDSR